jgi:tripartite ATP-independent transporter DctM subunit
MDWWVILAAGLALLAATFITGVPLFVAFLLVNFIGVLVMIGPSGFGLIANSIFDTVNIDALAALPLFILMGELLFRGGAIGELLKSVDKLVGTLPGRQYVLTSLLSTIFGALSGSAMAVSAMMSRSMFPGMVANGYERKMSAGVIMAGASLAPIIPPSVAVILIATLAGASIAKLLIAGIMPGLLLAGLFIAYTTMRCVMNPSLNPKTAAEVLAPPTLNEKMMALLKLSPIGLVIFSVMGFILLGIATPTEAAATGVVGALLTAAIFRKLSWPVINESLYTAALITGTILVIMASSNMFGQLLALTGTAARLTEAVSSLNAPIPLLVLMLMAITFVFCVFADEIAMLLILIPLFKPIVVALGINDVWFWTLMLINLVLGGITPPFGYTMYAFKSGAPDMPLGEVYAATWPFVAIYVVAIGLIIAFPQIATYLPGLL